MTIFGQNPADISGALFKSRNLGDVPNIATARANLQVPSITDVQYNSVPIGMILPFWGTVAPAGYLPCMGQTVNSTTFPDLVTFLGGTTSATVPDLRGEFLRGWDNGRGVDTGRAISSFQSATIVIGQAAANAASVSAANTSTQFNSLWGTESVASVPIGMSLVASPLGGTLQSPVTGNLGYVRPRNISVLYCIKAYSSVANYTSSFNVAGLVSDFSTLNAASVKYADFMGSNASKASSGYQKLPGGLILQWMTVIPTVFSNGYNYVNFPIAFPTAVLSTTVSPSAGAGAGAIFGSDSGGTLTQLRFTNTYASAQGGFAIAIGY